MVMLKCGCEVGSYDDGIGIRMKSEDIVHFVGFVPAVEYYKVCHQCYEQRYSKYPDLILTDEEELEYLNQDWSDK